MTKNDVTRTGFFEAILKSRDNGRTWRLVIYPGSFHLMNDTTGKDLNKSWPILLPGIISSTVMEILATTTIKFDQEPVAGSFTIHVSKNGEEDQITQPIQYNASADEIKAAVERLYGLPAVVVSLLDTGDPQKEPSAATGFSIFFKKDSDDDADVFITMIDPSLLSVPIEATIINKYSYNDTRITFSKDVFMGDFTMNISKNNEPYKTTWNYSFDELAGTVEHQIEFLFDLPYVQTIPPRGLEIKLNKGSQKLTDEEGFTIQFPKDIADSYEVTHLDTSNLFGNPVPQLTALAINVSDSIKMISKSFPFPVEGATYSVNIKTEKPEMDFGFINDFKTESNSVTVSTLVSGTPVTYSSGNLITTNFPEEGVVAEIRLSEDVFKSVINSLMNTLSTGDSLGGIPFHGHESFQDPCWLNSLDEYKTHIVIHDIGGSGNRPLLKMGFKVRGECDNRLLWAVFDIVVRGYYDFVYDSQIDNYGKIKGFLLRRIGTEKECIRDNVQVLCPVADDQVHPNNYFPAEIPLDDIALSTRGALFSTAEYDASAPAKIQRIAKIELLKNPDDSTAIGDLVFQFKKNDSSYYTEKNVLLPWLWTRYTYDEIGDEDGDNVPNMWDFCFYDPDNDCDKDGDMLRDDLDMRFYQTTITNIGNARSPWLTLNKKGSCPNAGPIFIKTWKEKSIYGKKIAASGSLVYRDDYQGSRGYDTYLSRYHCYCGENALQRGDCDAASGICGVNHAVPTSAFNEDFGRPTWNHVNRPTVEIKDNVTGITTKVVNPNQKFPSRKIGQLFNDPEDSFAEEWNWAENIKDYVTVNSTARLEPYLTEAERNIQVARGNYFGARFSSGLVKNVSNDEYLIGTGIDALVNISFFENSVVIPGSDKPNQLFHDLPQRDTYFTNAFAASPADYLPLAGWEGDWEEKTQICGGPDRMDYGIFDAMHDFLGIDPTFNGPTPGDPTLEHPIDLWKVVLDDGRVKMTEFGAPGGWEQIFDGFGGMWAYLPTYDGYELALSDSRVFFGKRVTLNGGAPHNFAATTRANGNVYIAGNKRMSATTANAYYELHAGKITYNEDTAQWNYLPIAAIPYRGTAKEIKLFTIATEPYAIVLGFDNMITFYKYDRQENTGRDSWSMLGSQQFNDGISLASLAVKGLSVYLVVPEDGTSLYSFTMVAGTGQVEKVAIVEPARYLRNARVYSDAGNLVVASFEDLHKGTTPMYAVANGEALPYASEVKHLATTSRSQFTEVCLSEQENKLVQGYEIGGICHIALADQTVALDTKGYAVAGYDNLLFVATRNGVAVYNITLTGEVEKLQVLAIGRVNDVLVSGTMLYAATTNGIAIYDAQTLELQKRVLSGKTINAFATSVAGMLFAGSGSRVYVYKIDSFTKVTEIPMSFISNPVSLAVAEQTLYVYDEWLGVKTYSLDTYKGTSWMFALCSEPKLAESDNAVYLGCGIFNNIFELETKNNATWISDRKNAPRYTVTHSYSYNGTVYSADDSVLRIKNEQ